MIVFEEIIARSPKHAQSLNYLGYMLADRGERLEYAKELIEKALVLSPDNAAYIDSYGWVLFQMGKINEAMSHLKKAAELGKDPEIFDHLGDTYHALGDSVNALIWWQKALELDPSREKIKKKIGNK